MTHITIASVTIYLHRGQAHRAVDLHPAVSHFMRFWLWLTTGMITRQWVAIHRKHHRFTEGQGDPHSPHVYGIWRVLFGGAFLYNDASRDSAMVEAYGVGTPNDWVEQNIYSSHSKWGITALLILETYLFHGWGIVMWLVQMAWIPFWAAGVVNGLGHFIGYRNHDTGDRSTNLGPIGVIIGGEELHNNHHHSPASAKLSDKWWEFDIGWLYIRTLEIMGFARVKAR